MSCFKNKLESIERLEKVLRGIRRIEKQVDDLWIFCSGLGSINWMVCDLADEVSQKLAEIRGEIDEARDALKEAKE